MKSLPPKTSTILSPERARAVGYGLVSVSSLVVVTCATAARTAPAPVVAAAQPAVSRAPAPSTSGAPPTETPVSPSPATPGFARFRAALSELAAGTRKESVRILWLGDSHAAADFWTDAVRRPLQAHYGAGGPGFLYAGLANYRHASTKLERDGRFRAEPKKPSLWTHQADGVFGLGGIRTVPNGDDARVSITLAKDALRGTAHWDVAYRLPSKGARFALSSADGPRLTVDASRGKGPGILHATLDAPATTTVTVGKTADSPELLGVSVEGSEPGVVVDTLGINGARIGTPLAWDEASWVAEASRRNASLFVLAYGTNEVGDDVLPQKYAAVLESLVERVRKAAPLADCLVVGPTDRADPSWATIPRVVEIDRVERETAERVGCVYFSTFEAMGGDGALHRWAGQTPALAASDRVHLTPAGYAELGAKVTALLVPELAVKPK